MLTFVTTAKQADADQYTADIVKVFRHGGTIDKLRATLAEANACGDDAASQNALNEMAKKLRCEITPVMLSILRRILPLYRIDIPVVDPALVSAGKPVKTVGFTTESVTENGGTIKIVPDVLRCFIGVAEVEETAVEA